MTAMDATERIDMTIALNESWSFRYELVAQASPTAAPLPVDISSRLYESKWLDERGSDTVLATAVPNMAESADGVVVMGVDVEEVATLGERDVWWFLQETNGDYVSVIASGYITIEDRT